MYINWQSQELNLKVVYYGPALSGKTTNLEQIHARVNPQRRSELVSIKTQKDRTLFFDFMQLELGKINNMTPKIHLYTVPGQSYYEASRRLVLRGADGVVFVADSSASRARRNIESWANMKSQLLSFELSSSDFPIVLQLNKQDLPDAITTETLQRLLDVDGLPILPAVAIESKGVSETLKTITRAVVAQVQRQIA